MRRVIINHQNAHSHALLELKRLRFGLLRSTNRYELSFWNLFHFVGFLTLFVCVFNVFVLFLCCCVFNICSNHYIAGDRARSSFSRIFFFSSNKCEARERWGYRRDAHTHINRRTTTRSTRDKRRRAKHGRTHNLLKDSHALDWIG